MCDLLRRLLCQVYFSLQITSSVCSWELSVKYDPYGVWDIAFWGRGILRINSSCITLNDNTAVPLSFTFKNSLRQRAIFDHISLVLTRPNTATIWIQTTFNLHPSTMSINRVSKSNRQGAERTLSLQLCKRDQWQPISWLNLCKTSDFSKPDCSYEGIARSCITRHNWKLCNPQRTSIV